MKEAILNESLEEYVGKSLAENGQGITSAVPYRLNPFTLASHPLKAIDSSFSSEVNLHSETGVPDQLAYRTKRQWES